MSKEAMKLALEQALEMLNDNREYIEANERPEYLAMYDKAIAGAEKALAEQPDHIEDVLAMVEQPAQQEPATAITRYELLKIARAAGLEEEFLVDPLSEQRFRLFAQIAVNALALQPAQQEPVTKPYAYEYGRDNGDGTYSVVIEKGDLVRIKPAVYDYVRPRNAHKDWPIKELFDRPQPPAQQDLPDLIAGSLGVSRRTAYDMMLEALKLADAALSGANMNMNVVQRKVKTAIEAAHGIKENT